MQFLQKTSIKGKQTLIVMLTSGVALLLACVAFASYEVMTFRAAMEDNLSTLAEIIGNNSAAALDFSDPKSATEALSALRAQPNIKGACIYTAKGEVFAVYKRSGSEAEFIPPIVQRNGQYFSKDLLQLFRPVVRDGEFLGTVYVVSDLNALYSRLDKYAIISVGVFFASSFVAFLLSSRLGRLISGPILSLVQTARAVTEEKNYSVRAVKQSDDELGVLIDAFNEMLRQIQERDAALQKTHIELEERVTERTQEVVNSLSLVRATLESTTDGILATDGSGRVTSFNEKFVEMWHISPQVLGLKETQKMAEAVSQQLCDPEQFLSKIDRIYAEPEKESFDLIEFKDGKIFERYSKLQRVEDKCVGRVWSFRDITERKRSEVELEGNRRLLDGVLKNSMDGIMAYEAIRDEQGNLMDLRFLLVNPSAELLLGQPAAEVVGRGLLDTFPDIVLDGLFEPFVRIVETGATLDFEYSTVRSTALRWYRVAGVKLGDGLVVSYSDITERKKTDQQLHVQYAIGRVLVEASTLEKAAPQILQIICENLGWDAGGLWLLDRRAEVLRCDEIWNVPGFDVEEFRAASKQMTFARGVGLPGRVWSSGQPAWIHDVVQDANFPRSPVAGKAGLHGAFGFPILVGDEIGAVIELFGREPRVPDDSLLLIVASLGSQIGQFFQRKRSEAELDEMHKQLVDTSRQAGMAEVATSVLHNVGNVLNSVNVSSTLVSNQVRKSKAANLSKVVALLNEHAADIGDFLTNDPKGKQLPGYLGQLAEHLVGEQTTVLKELKLLHENIEHIKDIVVMQQSYAKISGVIETVNITDLVEDALRLNLGALQRHGVEVLREYEDLPLVDVEKHKILQILVNLVRNAKYACDESLRPDKLMTLRVTRASDLVNISVMDNGIGIPAENLTRIFNHGFTTRKDGHGFGLHSAVLAAMEMGGALKVHSDGADKGATFTLELPYKPHKNST